MKKVSKAQIKSKTEGVKQQTMSRGREKEVDKWRRFDFRYTCASSRHLKSGCAGLRAVSFEAARRSDGKSDEQTV
jgi:hypothetical protein